MLTLLVCISSEIEALIRNTKDLRYIQLPSATEELTIYPNNEMTAMTEETFKEAYRNNDKRKRNVVPLREKEDAVNEIVIYNDDAEKGSFLYFKGDFDPIQGRQMI